MEDGWVDAHSDERQKMTSRTIGRAEGRTDGWNSFNHSCACLTHSCDRLTRQAAEEELRRANAANARVFRRPAAAPEPMKRPAARFTRRVPRA